MRSSRKYLYLPRRAKGNSEGEGIQKEAISGGCGGLLFRVFFPGASSKIGELLKTKSCSVKQTNSFFIFFTVNDLLKQELLS